MTAAHAENWPGILTAASPLAEPPALLSLAEEAMAPEQFFTLADRSGTAWTPERRLLLAVLEDAVMMFLRHRNDHSKRGKRLFRETQSWFDSTDRISLCAFESICDYLNLDADYLRLGLRRVPEATSATRVSLNNASRQPRYANCHLTVVPPPDRS